MRAVYNELHALAAAKLARERDGQTLQPTALVHEAWLRLGGDHQPSWANRAHFFAAAAESMRRILIERARRRHAARHGANAEHVPLHQADPHALALASDDQLLAVNEALEQLAAIDRSAAELVKLRYFAGLSMSETALALGISDATAWRRWNYARAWLLRALRPP